ncbi:/ lplJ / Lipoate-protein ligase LplJ /:390050 Reverse [Candidatus Hepatoplasma crinochetorum]|uniref:lipoate--protein ligase n=1 Tax=Candidatus Hepatoplasma crinochetorum TaxID=295596 RepID=A0A0G7ZMV4_9MOLU|nr:/ lplJ / Lipoate-protein ligase LplJ /:390050 Reverse [Candidatus Hepatoplasma crinochetorum]
MKYILSKTNNPYFNLAAEEYIINNLNEDLFYVYVNKPSVIIGKNQDPINETNIEYLKDNNILLVRRISGGGAVYQDLGNVNYSFVLKGKAKDIYKFEEYSRPIVNFLKNKLHLNAEFGGRNDISINDKKISGIAQFVSNNNLIFHGTLIFNVDFSNVNKILTPNYDKILSKGVKSIQKRVGNIYDELLQKITKEEFIGLLIDNISDDKEYKFTVEQLKEINKIAKIKEDKIKFLLENRNEYKYKKSEYISGFGTIQIYFNLEAGKIIQFEIFGEYFSKHNTDDIKNKFIGKLYDQNIIRDIVYSIDDFENYFYNLNRDKLISLIMM